MKLAIAGVGVLVVLVVAVFVATIGTTNDDTPDALRRCLTQTDALVVHGPDVLGALRRDLVLKTPPRAQRLRIGDNDAVVLRGTGYRVVALAGRKSPSLGGDVAMRVYQHPDAYALVAIEPGDSSGMVGCTRTVK